MLIKMISKTVFSFCCINLAIGYVLALNELPLQVSIVTIGTDYAVFDVTGPITLYNLPVKSVGVNYTEIPYTSKNKLIQPSLNHTVINIKSDFDRKVNITNLKVGSTYRFQFYAINVKNDHGPLSETVEVLLRPETPDFSITHHGLNAVRMFWGYPNEKLVDYFLLTIEKESAVGCGFTLNFTRCFGNSYDFTAVEMGQVYLFKILSHNPSGFSDTVLVRFPYE